MNRSIEVMVWGFVALALMVMAFINILRGGVFDYIQSLVLIAPFLFIIILRLRSHWHVFVLVGLVADSLSPPVAGLNQLTPLFMFLGVLLGLRVLDRSMKAASKDAQRTWIDTVHLLIALILTARLIYDRPGFAGLGSARGGLINSLEYTLAAWFYFVVRDLIPQANLTRSQLRGALWVVMFLSVFALFLRREEHITLIRGLGNSEFWMMCALMVSLMATSHVALYRNLLFYIVSIGFIGIGLISGFRARILYFFTTIVSVAFLTGRGKRTFFIVGGTGAAAIVIILLAGLAVPASMERVLSLFGQAEVRSYESIAVGAMGWQDAYRVQLYELAWGEIQQNPFVGRGFGLRIDEAIGILVASQRAHIELLALAGAYHNSVVALAVIAGLPIAILYTLVLFVPPWRYWRWLRIRPPSDERTWALVVMGFWCANIAMLLLNGGARQFLSSMVLNGLMVGLMNRQRVPVVAAVKSEPTVPARVMGPFASKRPGAWSDRPIGAQAFMPPRSGM
jgi:hypothetical protein